MENVIRILIADDHAMVRRGLAQILEKSGGMQIVAEYANGIHVLNWLCNNDCDVALLDIAMPGMNGIDLLKQLKQKKPKLPVLIITAYPEDQFAVRLIKAGAAGYLNKECAPEEVVNAVNSVVGGKMYISPAVTKMLANEVRLPDGKLAHETLSTREYQIFLLFASAKSISEIAAILSLSVKTVSTYRTRILEKMQLRNNLELMQYVVDKNLLK